MTWIFSFISRTPTDPFISHTCYPPISPALFYVPYFIEFPPCLYIFSTLLGAACLSSTQWGWGWADGHRFLFGVPELSSGLSFQQMVGFSLVHSLLGFLSCESWVRLN